jgi:hypothetical protein
MTNFKKYILNYINLEEISLENLREEAEKEIKQAL